MNDIFEVIGSYLRKKSLRKTANLASIIDSSPAAQQASQQRRYFPIKGIPVPEEALQNPSFLTSLLEDSQRKEQTSDLPTYDPNNPFSQLALAEKMYDLRSKMQDRATANWINLLGMQMQMRAMQQSLLSDIATRRWQMFANLVQTLMLPALERYRIMASLGQPQNYIIPGREQPQAAPQGPLPSYVRIHV